MGRSAKLLSRIAKAAGVSSAVHYTAIREALMRACYRGLLKREPEKAVIESFEHPLLPSDQEAALAKMVATFADSPEFKLIRSKSAPYPADTWVRAEVLDGLKLWVDLGDMFVSDNCIRGDYEPAETKFLQSTLKTGMTFVDVGANIGWFTLLGARLVGKEGRVYAFEPRDNTFKHLKRSIADNGFDDRCEAYNLALGAKAGEWPVAWSQNTLNPGGTWSVPNPELEAFFKKIGHAFQRAKVAALDDIIGEHHVDVIKADIEGAEPLAMRGAIKILTRDRPIILSEINTAPMQKVSGVTAADYVQQIAAHGYECRELSQNGPGLFFTGEPTQAQVVNVVFMPK